MILFNKLRIIFNWDYGCGFAFPFSYEDQYSWSYNKSMGWWSKVISIRILYWYAIVSVLYKPEGFSVKENK